MQKADDSGKQQSAAQFVKAKITRYDSLEENIADRKMETRTIVITDAKKVNRLASFFPGLGEHRESPRGNGWEKFADIWFFRDDGNSMRLSVDPALDTWAEGKGAWPVRSPKEFQAYFRTLFAEHEKK